MTSDEKGCDETDKLETMLNDPTPPETSLGELPVEVKATIFSKLAENDRKMLRLVCSATKNAVDLYLGVHLRITNLNWDEILKSDFYVLDATFQSLTRSLDWNDGDTIGFLGKLRHVELGGWLEAENCIGILKSCKNVEALVFRDMLMPEFNHVEFQSLKFDPGSFNLRRLKCVKLICRNRDDLTAKNLVGFLTFLKNALINGGARMTDLEIRTHLKMKIILYNCIFPYFNNTLEFRKCQEYSLIREIFQEQRVTLRTLVLEQILSNQQRNSGSYFEGPLTLELLPSHSNNVYDIQFSKLDLTAVNQCNKTTGSQFMINILMHQNRLKKIVNRSVSFDHWSFVFSSLNYNCRTLTSIHFDFSHVYLGETWGMDLTASIFSDCSNLTSLTLLQKDNSREYYYLNPQIRLTDVYCLPQPLRSFTTNLPLCFPMYPSMEWNLGKLFPQFKQLEVLNLSPTPWFCCGEVASDVLFDTIFTLGSTHLKDVIESIPSLRTVDIMCKLIDRVHIIYGTTMDNDIVTYTEEMNIAENLIPYVQNHPHLRFECEDMVFTPESHTKMLKVTILPGFREKGNGIEY